MRRFLSILGLLALLSPLIAGWPQPVAAARRITPNPLLRAVNLSAARMGLLGAVPSARRVVLQNAAVADGNGTSIDVTGMGTVAAQITGLGSATIHWEATVNRTDWVAISATNITSAVPGATATANGVYSLSASGASLVRARISDWLSGTITVVAIAVPLGGAGAGGGGGGGGASTIADGADVALGATTDASAQNAPGTAIAHLRGLNEILFDIWDQTNHVANFGMATVLDHTQDTVESFTANGENVALGSTTDAAVGDATGTANSHLRQIAKVITAGSPTSLIAGAVNAGAYVSGSVLSGAYADGSIVSLGANADAATSGTGTLNAHSRQTALNTANIPAQGQAAMASSTPVAIASNQSAVPVSGTVTANLGTGTGLFQPQAGTAGGATPYFFAAAGGANQDATVIKASAGTLYNITATNNTASQRYIWLYNVASGATSASTVVYGIALPANTTGSGATISIPVGMAFSTGISFRITTGVPGSSTAAASANDVFVSCAYL
jgi:hypothetical protein